MLPKISQSKENQTKKTPKNHAENEARKLVPDLLLFFKKLL